MGQAWNVLLIDDDTLIHDTFALILPDNWKLTAVSSPDQVPDDFFHAAFVDMHLKGHTKTTEGPDVIENLSKTRPHLEIVAISGDLNRQIMEECLKKGATRFLAKPFTPEEIRNLLGKIEAIHLLTLASQRTLKKNYWIGNSPESEKLKRAIAQFKGEPGPILIEGEPGTGKEVTVQMIHEQESERPFIAVNVAAIPENLFESELFGHTKGAFTGADQNKMGLAEAAHGGDLFLDEIEALTPSCQVKLLRFLETSEVRRLGSKTASHVQVRVILATNQNLEKLVKELKFREDLLWRINGKKIILPTLRERKNDIVHLAKFFLEQQKPRYNKTFTEESLACFQDYSWPGNIRELKRMIEQIALSSPLPFIRKEDVSKYLTSTDTPAADINLNPDMGLEELMADFEKKVIEKCLSEYKEVDKAAQALQISRSGLYKKIKDHNLETEED
jgi:DNA-binding NtrC family response regulator